MRTPHRLLSVLLALLVLPIASAEDDARAIGLTREGLSVEVPEGWSLDQYGSANLKLAREKTIVWFYEQDAPRKDAAANLRRMADRLAGDMPEGEAPDVTTWRVRGATEAHRLEYVEAGQHRLFAVIEREGLPGFDVEAIWPPDCPKGVRAELDRILDSLDVRPYATPGRFVDWTLGFTLDGVADWNAKADEGGVQLRPERAPGATLRVRAAPTTGQAITRLDRVIEASLARVRGAGLGVDASPYTRFEMAREHGGPLPAVRTEITLTKDGAAAGTVTIEAMIDGDVALIVAGNGEGLARARAVAKTFRAGTEPGRRKDVKPPR